jgi:hypothetical protein
VTKHERFLQIERGSPDCASESESADRSRIAAVLAAAPASRSPDSIEIAAGAPAGDGVPPAWPDRDAQVIEAPAEGATSADLTLDVAVPEGQPFVRCARCGADSSIHAVSCDHCAARLDTPEQRAFNDRLWEARRLRSEEERAALDEMAAARYENAKSAVRPLPEPGMLPPPELLEAPGDDDGPILLGALGALQKPQWRWAAGAAAAGIPLLLATLGGPILSSIGWVLVALFFLSLLPRSVGRRFFDWWVERHRLR